MARALGMGMKMKIASKVKRRTTEVGVSVMNAVQTITSDTTLSPVAIGDLFLQARATHVESVSYLFECGRRLQQKRESLKRGDWLPWLRANEQMLGFGERTAQLLMKASATNPQLTSDLPPAEAAAINRRIWGNDRPRKPKAISTEAPAPEPASPERPGSATPDSAVSEQKPHQVETVSSDEDEPERPSDMEALDKEAAENYARERQNSLDKLLDGNDALASAVKEIERQAQEIVGLRVSLAGEMNGKSFAIREKKAADRQIAALERKLEQANEKIHDLTERIAQMEGA
jgi:hypothetical protein